MLKIKTFILTHCKRKRSR